MRAWIPQLNSLTFSRGAWRHGIGRSFRELLGFTDDVRREDDLLQPTEAITEEITTKGGGHMKLQKCFDKILHNSRLHATLRRGVAFAMSLALVVPMVPTFGATVQTGPIQSTDYPRVEIESNFVRDEFGFLTGYLELGLRVQTPAGKHFQRLSVTLEYDTSVLTPVDWAEESNDIIISGVGYYKAQLPAAKLEEISTATAFTGIPAQTPGGGGGGETGGGETGGDGGVSTAADGESGDGDTGDGETTPVISDAVQKGEKALMTFVVSSREKQTYEEMTTLGVVRFRVSEEEMEKISITKKSADDYEVNYKYKDESNTTQIATVTNIAELAKVAKVKLAGFAADADIKLSNSNVELALDYVAENLVGGTFFSEEYYHVPEYDPNDANTYLKDFTEKINGKVYAFKDQNVKPKSLNTLLLAVDKAVGDPDQEEKLADKTTPNPNYGLPNRYSYTTNLMVNPEEDYVQHKEENGGWVDSGNYIAFTVVSKKSFTAPGDMLGNLTTIVYVDWDNTFLGTQVVPKRTDVRGLVSDFVAENFVYHDDDDDYYTLNDLNNIAESAKRDGTTAQAVVSSLARVYSYRGKYPASAPMALKADGTVQADSPNTVVDELDGMPKGSQYALTNKLDYVFFKRPMTHTEAFDQVKPKQEDFADADAYKAALAQYEADYEEWYWAKTEWSQKLAEDIDGNPTTDPLWDTENPYAYGWAQCTVDNYADTWTTLGWGELDSYNGAISGGYQAIPDPDGIARVTYSDATETPFAFADLQKGFTQGTVFLKAVYEPGEDLANNLYTYRMISQPYYNKLNRMSTVKGGTYSVDVALERSNVVDGVLVGVSRLRSPSVRQDVTPDHLWLADADLGVTLGLNHNVPNPDNASAYTGKEESLYSIVDVSNTDIMPFTLNVTARNNKVDYYLKEAYGSNKIAGSERSDKDSTRGVGSATLDNYNYYVKGESDETDVWYDAPYENRDGSRGFVLEGTLNQFMQLATQNQATDLIMLQYVNDETLPDINLRLAGGKFATSSADLAKMRGYLCDAADLAENLHNSGNDQFWDVDHGYAKLNYHQLQGYILQRETGAPPTLNHPESDLSGALGLTWCHLHADCAAASSTAPKDWPELIDAARSHDEDIDLITDYEGMTHLRKDYNATPFGTLSEFKSAFTAAVSALDAAAGGGTQTTIYSWDDVQQQILVNLGYAPGTPKEDYWWYDGSTAVPGNFDGVLDALTDATDTTTAKTPDGDTGARDAQLNTLETAFDANAAADAADPGATDPAWITLTHNLCGNATKEGEPFGSFADFKTAVKGAYAALQPAYPTPDWYQLQYMILNPTATPPAPEGDPNAPADYVGYWWYDGERDITNIKTMLDAAIKDGGVWKAFTQTKYNTLVAAHPEWFYYVAGFDGTAFADFDTMKAAIKTLADNNSADTDLKWEQVQYLLIHANDTTPVLTPPTDNSDNVEANKYYWWVNGNTTPPNFTHTPNVKGVMATLVDINSLLEVAFRIEKNGIPAANSGLDATALDGYRLQKAQADTANYQTNLTDAATLLSTLQTLLQTVRAQGIGSEYSAPDFTQLSWFQVQYALLNGGAYADGTTVTIPTDTEYWWRNNDSQKDDLGDILKILYDYYAGTLTKTVARNTITPAQMSGAGLKQRTGAEITTTAHKNTAANVILTLVDAIKGDATLNQADWMDAATGQMKLSLAELQGAIDANATTIAKAKQYLDSIKAAHPSGTALEVELASALSVANVAALTLDAMKTDPALVSTLAADPGYVSALQTQLELVTGKTVELKDPETTPVVTEKPAETPAATPSPAPEATPSPAPTPTPSPTPDEDKVYGNDQDVELKGPAATETDKDNTEDTEDGAPSRRAPQDSAPQERAAQDSAPQDSAAVDSTAQESVGQDDPGLPTTSDLGDPGGTGPGLPSDLDDPGGTDPDPTPPDPTPPDTGPLPTLEDTVSFLLLRPTRIYGITPLTTILAAGGTLS